MRNFHAFTARAKPPGRASAIITPISIMPAFDPANPPEPLKHIDVVALWDTGATGSFISPAAAQRLGVVAVGSRNVNHAAGTGVNHPMYLLNLRLPNTVGVAGIEAVEFSSPLHFEFIIGMNIITLGDFAITNVEGKTCVSFRTPSCAEIDYVAEAGRRRAEDVQPTRAMNVGRNDPCPCGSGKKYKKCHGGPNPPA